MTKKSYQVKVKILKWAHKHGRLPSYRASKPLERRLGQRLENYMSQANASFDSRFREKVLKLYPRNVRNKRRHDTEQRMREVLDFMQLHRRPPSIVGNAEERQLHRTFSNYVYRRGKFQPTSRFLQKIKQLDHCHASRIPLAFRKCINKVLGKKPLVKETIYKKRPR